MSIPVTIDTNSNSLLDAMEGILFDYAGRVQTRYEVIGFAEEAQEVLSKWQAAKAEKDAKDQAARDAAAARRLLEDAAAIVVNSAPRVGQEATR